MRIQKFLSTAGVSSRRKGEELILAGRVRINNRLAKIGDIVDLNRDRVFFDDKEVFLQENKIYILLNKPKGYITSLKDEKGRKTVLDLLDDVKERVYPVGRLDYNTSGLLLLTNDGDSTNKLIHPRHEIEKIYKVKCVGELSKEDLNKLENGIIIDDNYLTRKANLYDINIFKDYSTLSIGIKEGKNRQIRKMFKEIKHDIVSLKRIQIGFLRLGNLKSGKYRFLSEKEISDFKRLLDIGGE